MERLFQIGLSNAAAAAVLAVLAAVATRLWRNPHFSYALWLIVLLRMVAPPLVPMPVPLPAWAVFHPTDSLRVGTIGTGSSAIDERTPTRAPGMRAANAAQSKPVPHEINDSATFGRPRESLSMSQPSAANLIAAIWAAGTIIYGLLVSVRVGRFSRAIRSVGRDIAEPLRAEGAAVAAMIGLERTPRLALVEGPLPPMVWPGWRPTVLLPRSLTESLSSSQRRLLLLHEFTHIRRGDHLVRWFEIGVVALYWWNPFAWWTVRRLQRAEEECCDAAVLFFQADQPEAYGQTLLAVSEFLSTGTLPAPAPSIGVVRKNHLKRRLTMILSGPRWPKLSKARRLSLSILGAALMAVTWTVVVAQNKSVQPLKPASGGGKPLETSTAKSRNPKGNGDNKLPALLAFKPLEPMPGDDELQRLLKERYNAAVRALRLYEYQYEIGTARAGDVCAAARIVVEAESALVDKPQDEIRVLQHYLEFTKSIENEARAKLQAGGVSGISPVDEAQAREARLEAEIKLLRLRAAVKDKTSDTIPTATERRSIVSPQAPRHSPSEAKQSQSASGIPALLTSKPLKAVSSDDELRKLLKERFNAALLTLQHSYNRHSIDISTNATNVVAAARRLLDAQLALDKSQDVVRVYERYLELMNFLERRAESQFQLHNIGRDELEEAHEARLDAEVKLLEATRARS